jgi:hypothetical protein
MNPSSARFSTVERRRWQVALLALVVIPACVSDQTKREAIQDINAAFKPQYEATLAKYGVRTVDARPDVAFDAVNAAMVRLGFVVQQQSRGLGLIAAEAPAPRPLDLDEWNRAAAADLPQTREILRRHIGALAESFNFDSQGLDTVLTATIIGTGTRSEISFTMRLREVAAARGDLPRREYPPPSTLKVGLDKIWAAFDQELARRRAP